MVEKYFYIHSLKGLYEHLESSKRDAHDFIKTRLKNLKHDMKKITDNEIKKEKLDLPADLVKKILDATEIKQQGQGLNILTPKQMIIKLPVLLAQLKFGNNSEKLINEIRQIVYSLYRSKNLSKTIYNNLVSTI